MQLLPVFLMLMFRLPCSVPGGDRHVCVLIDSSQLQHFTSVQRFARDRSVSATPADFSRSPRGSVFPYVVIRIKKYLNALEACTSAFAPSLSPTVCHCFSFGWIGISFFFFFPPVMFILYMITCTADLKLFLSSQG